MNVKIQGGGKNAGVYANTGSCAKLVEYLEHEDAERLAQGFEIHQFFNGLGLDVTSGEVLQKIDRNHKKLHYSDAKFYHLDINPSQDELRAMGSTNEEIIANCKVLAMKLTELYAKNFNKSIVVGKDKNGNDIVRPLSAEDIMIFWKVHENRDEKEGLQIHIHGIPSRKDIHNKYQLSPVTNHKGTQQGPVIGGFERTTFYKEVEKLFDETFDYNRKPEETFEYCLKKKEERKAAEKVATMIKELDKEKGIEVSAPDTKIKEALARRDQRRRNEFWNDYHSKYRPEYNKLKDACDKSFSLYQTAKDNYGVCSAAITEKYNNLRNVYSQMNALQDDVQKASTAKGIVKAVSALVFFINPVAGIVMGLVGSTIAEAERSAAIAAKKDLRAQAAAIKDSIEGLKAEQAALRQDKADRLKVYVENKEAKTALQTEINNLKAALDKPEPKEQAMKSFMEGYAKHVAEKKQVNSLEAGFVAYARKAEILSVFKDSKDAASLQRNLADHGLSFKEIKSSRGVEDITITASGDTPFEMNVGKFGTDFHHQILEQLARVTNQKPAYKTAQEIERAQRVRMARNATQNAMQIKAAQEAARQEAQRKVAEEAQRQAAQRQAAQEAQRQAAQEAAKQEEQRRTMQEHQNKIVINNSKGKGGPSF